MIKDNLSEIRDNIVSTALKCGRDPKRIKLVAVSKRFPAEAILEAHAAGQFLFGENYIQEASEKRALIKETVQFHFIGHLQTNKARVAAEIFDMIETVDRVKIASALNKHLQQINKKLDILVQVNIGRDSGKSGVLPENAEALLNEIKCFDNLHPKGLMTMVPFTEDLNITRQFYRDLRILTTELQTKNLLPEKHVELSMGMSDDYQVAIEEGATLIRIGTAIFGQRPSK